VREPELLSVVAPMYFEEDTAQAFHVRVASALEGLEWELVLVDDGSEDRTPAILAGLADRDRRVKVVTLSRNFGHQAALTAGLEHAAGDVVVMLDADLQDPPELIPEMLDRWRAGADVVCAVREHRDGETRAKLATARWFYGLFGRLSDVPLAADSGDFRLMGRPALDALLAMGERHRFLRGMSVWVGFTQTAVTYRRDARFAGRTKFTWRRMLTFSFDAIASFSHVPLQLATLIGFACAAAAFALVPLVMLAKVYDQFALGIPSVLVVTLLLGGIQLLCLGIVGEYVGRVYDEVKDRPLYIVRGRRNLGSAEPPARRERHPERIVAGR
jgi:glycosyltransferase involved in cell wall biosynthesis